MTILQVPPPEQLVQCRSAHSPLIISPSAVATCKSHLYRPFSSSGPSASETVSDCLFTFPHTGTFSQRHLLNCNIPRKQNMNWLFCFPCCSVRVAPAPQPKLTYDTVFKWSRGLRNVLSTKYGQKLFEEFLRGEHSDENILFWCAVQELKQETRDDKMREKVRIIYEDFISLLSPKEVSLNAETRATIDTAVNNPETGIFDDAQQVIFKLMETDSFPRFLGSDLYKAALAQFGVTELDVTALIVKP